MKRETQTLSYRATAAGDADTVAELSRVSVVPQGATAVLVVTALRASANLYAPLQRRRRTITCVQKGTRRVACERKGLKRYINCSAYARVRRASRQTVPTSRATVTILRVLKC
eukprot:scaffold549_cov117-Isochrysis_galbana.AAC.4